MVVQRLVEHYTVHISDDQADNWQLHANIMAISALGNKTNTPAFCFLSGNFKKNSDPEGVSTFFKKLTLDFKENKDMVAQMRKYMDRCNVSMLSVSIRMC